MYANVIVDISHEKVDRVFQYHIPVSIEEQIKPGMEVQIPFGRGNKLISGYVMELTQNAEWEPEKIKDIASVVPKRVLIEQDFIAFASWIKETYGSTMIAALKTVLPAKQVVKEIEHRTVVARASREELAQAAYECKKKKFSAQERLLTALLDTTELPMELLTDRMHISAATVQALIRKELISTRVDKTYRNPITFRKESEIPPQLSDEQLLIVNTVKQDTTNQNPGVYLLHGITGSGKTEVYIRLIADVITSGRQAIMLIPEISLTYQTVLRFYRRFGDRVTVMHSKLSKGERYSQMERARNGEVDVVIGPRSALFAPFRNLGIIIIDEEHEASYKSEGVPKYHARECAIWWAKMHNASVVLGSATPSVESYYRAKNKEFRLLKLTKRLTGGELPTVYTVDMRRELEEKNRSIFSRRLAQEIENRLERGEQTILFLNRRGYAGFVSCRTCGKVIKCPHCDVSLSEHRNNKLVCHYCGYERSAVTECPDCGSPYVGGFKAGTEQIEEMIHKKFPLACVLRMDADTTKTKGGYEKILSAFANKEADILLGTQMIVKGHDFPGVTLVGILAADLSLGVNDYRAAERTFQLLTQAAGRAGRGQLPGEVIIQTYQPEHYAVTYAAQQNYEGFYDEEIAYRELMSYPPAAHVLAVVFLSKFEKEAFQMANCMRIVINASVHAEGSTVIGPAPAGIGKINDIYRVVIYVKEMDMLTLTKIKDEIEAAFHKTDYKMDALQFDLDPMDTY